MRPMHGSCSTSMRIKDLIDNYQPDLLYTDGGIPFDEWGYRLVSHYYNVIAKAHGGKVEPYTSKTRSDCATRNVHSGHRARHGQ